MGLIKLEESSQGISFKPRKPVKDILELLRNRLSVAT